MLIGPVFCKVFCACGWFGHASSHTAYLEVNELRVRVDRHCSADASQGDNGWGQCHLLVCQGPELSTEACSPKPRQHSPLPMVL